MTDYKITLPEKAMTYTDKETGVQLYKGTIQNRKERHFYQEITALAPCKNSADSFLEVVTVRLYGTDSRNYAVIWVNPKNGAYLGGGGNAGGYGYHRPSAAMESAMDAAGIKMQSRESKDGFNAQRGNASARKWREGGLSGRGDRPMREVVKAIAKAAGYPRARIHVSHS